MKKCSLEHELFIKRQKKERILVIVSQFMIFLSFIIMWEILSNMHIINSFLFSSPSHICHSLYKLIMDGSLWIHISITMYEILISFVLSISLGVLIAIIMWCSPFIAKVIDPYLTIINSLPKVALGPLIIIWFGASTSSIIFMSLLISLFVTTINIYNGFISTPKNYIMMIRSFGAKKWQIFHYVVFPYNIKNIISTLKVNISLNLIGVIMGELLVSKKGLGYLILYGSQVFNIDLILSCVFILGIVSYLLYISIQKIK